MATSPSQPKGSSDHPTFTTHQSIEAIFCYPAIADILVGEQAHMLPIRQNSRTFKQASKVKHAPEAATGALQDARESREG